MAAEPLLTNFEAPAEFDRKALRARADRFRWHHRERYLAALAKSAEAGRDVVAALPALFHFNEPALPGYIPDAPHGLPDYKPDSITSAALKRVAPGATIRAARRSQDLQAIFLMGSGGSIGHTGDSDIDLWVCCEKHAHETLRPKLETLTDWAATLGVQLQGFLVDAASFADDEDTVHDAMLLDEFYRSGIWLAGAEPLWWYVDGAPSAAYYTSAAQLSHFRVVENTIDFGPVGRPSLEALQKAAQREMSQALATPYKSLLKLALVESYFDAPDAPLLSNRYQTLLVGGESDASQLDTYAMLYDHLEEYGAGSIGVDGARDLFVRRILPRARGFRNHEGLLSRFKNWGYDDQALKAIRNPQGASVQRCVAEYDKTLSLLRRGLHAAQRIDPSIHYELASLERKPLRAMDPTLRFRIQPALMLANRRKNWLLLEDQRTVLQSSNYVEPLVWLWLQQFDHLNLRFATPWLERAGRRLLDALDQAQRIVFLNALPNAIADETTLLSAQDDPLSYGGMETNLLRQVTIIEHDGQSATVAAHNTPETAIVAIADVAARDGRVAVTAADIEDLRLVRRIEQVLKDTHVAFAESRPVELRFGRGRVRLHPPGQDQSVEFIA